MGYAESLKIVEIDLQIKSLLFPGINLDIPKIPKYAITFD